MRASSVRVRTGSNQWNACAAVDEIDGCVGEPGCFGAGGPALELRLAGEGLLGCGAHRGVRLDPDYVGPRLEQEPGEESPCPTHIGDDAARPERPQAGEEIPDRPRVSGAVAHVVVDPIGEALPGVHQRHLARRSVVATLGRAGIGPATVRGGGIGVDAGVVTSLGRSCFRRTGLAISLRRGVQPSPVRSSVGSRVRGAVGPSGIPPPPASLAASAPPSPAPASNVVVASNPPSSPGVATGHAARRVPVSVALHVPCVAVPEKPCAVSVTLYDAAVAPAPQVYVITQFDRLPVHPAMLIGPSPATAV